ncbi:unnamed protein product [Prunus armeniaca]|uniref:Uncharacterized protein n=1 Tax=Prunus armeniaca TaxID=36596 RepID=A0A6J5X7X0_PRUAR|nr:unnamed protein product [Prunus armeniaca]
MRENITFITQLITWRFEIGQKLLVSSRLEDGLRNEDAPPVLFHHINIVVIGVELDISCALIAEVGLPGLRIAFLLPFYCVPIAPLLLF